jgi:pimeloyl-ACP methyl ester carboxylesterase
LISVLLKAAIWANIWHMLDELRRGDGMSVPNDRSVVSNATIQEASVKVNEQTVHYLRAGTGSVVVLVHGYPESSETWRKVIPELAQQFTVIAPDTRGVGSSSIATDFSIEDAADDIYELVKRLGFQKVSLVGQDFGVQVVSAYAAKHRQDVRALVVTESPLSAFGLEDLFGRFWHFGFLASPFAEMLIAGKEKEFFTELHPIRHRRFHSGSDQARKIEGGSRLLPGSPKCKGLLRKSRDPTVDVSRPRHRWRPRHERLNSKIFRAGCTGTQGAHREGLRSLRSRGTAGISCEGADRIFVDDSIVANHSGGFAAEVLMMRAVCDQAREAGAVHL